MRSTLTAATRNTIDDLGIASIQQAMALYRQGESAHGIALLHDVPGVTTASLANRAIKAGLELEQKRVPLPA